MCVAKGISSYSDEFSTSALDFIGFIAIFHALFSFIVAFNEQETYVIAATNSRSLTLHSLF